MERLQKIIAQSGIASRRKAEELITSGVVRVNGEVVTELGTKVSQFDEISVHNETITKQEHIYLLMNKPRFVVTTTSDELGRDTVISILPKEYESYRLFPVGRLDYDTKGVLIITNDGELMNMLVGPKSELEKEYLVRINGLISKENIKKLESGILLDGKKTRRCRVFLESTDTIHQSSLVKIILKEGKYHQVKRMFEAIGHEVKRLTRTRMGELTTEGLSEGEVRPIKPHELKRLYILSHPRT